MSRIFAGQASKAKQLPRDRREHGHGIQQGPAGFELSLLEATPGLQGLEELLTYPVDHPWPATMEATRAMTAATSRGATSTAATWAISERLPGRASATAHSA